MSHTYFVTKDNTPEGEKLEEINLSNADHEDWMTKAGLTRTMQNRETGELEEWLFHTTNHDPQPLCLYVDAFADYVDLAQEAIGEEVPEHMRALYDFIATVEALESLDSLEADYSAGYRIWIF